MDLTDEEVDLDVERFFIKYIIDKEIDGIEPEDVPMVFLLYMSQHFVHKDATISEKLN